MSTPIRMAYNIAFNVLVYPQGMDIVICTFFNEFETFPPLLKIYVWVGVYVLCSGCIFSPSVTRVS